MKYKLEGISTGGHCEHLWLTLPEYGVGVLMNNDYTKEPEEGESFDVGIYELEGEDGMGEHFEGCFHTLQNFQKSDIVARMVGYVEGHGFKRSNQQEQIEALVENELSILLAWAIEDQKSFRESVGSMLRDGFSGYENYPAKKLQTLFNNLKD